MGNEKQGAFQPQLTDFDSSESGGTIWNHDNGYQVDSATETAQSSWIDNLLDPTGLIKGFYNDLTGTTSQSREFSQQEYLQDKQNAYNDPSAQMARMKAAGINPNLAASGISQGGNESAQAPAVSSNTSGASQGLSAIGSAMGGVSSLALTAAQKRNLDASTRDLDATANRTNALVEYEVDQFRANTAKTWIDAGMDKHMADYWSVKASYADRQEWLDVQGKFWNIERCKQDIANLEQDYNIKVKQIEILKEQLSQEEYRTQMMAVDKWFQDERKNIYLARGIDVNQTEDGMLVEAFHNNQQGFILDAYEQKANVVAKGNYDAFRNQLREQLQIEWDENLKGRLKELEQDKSFQEEMMKLGLKGAALNTAIQTFLKYVFGTGFSVNVGKVGVTNNAPTK